MPVTQPTNPGKLYSYEDIKGATLESDPALLKQIENLYGVQGVSTRWTNPGNIGFEQVKSHVLNRRLSVSQGNDLSRQVDRYINWNGSTNPNDQAGAENQKTLATTGLEKLKAQYTAMGIDPSTVPQIQDYEKKLGLNGGVGQTAEQTAAQTKQVTDAAMVAAGQDPNTGATVNPAQQKLNTDSVLAGKGQVTTDANGKPLTGNPTEQTGNNPAGNTLDQIQASPIPPLPPEYGQGSGLDQANWALQHRANIFAAYQKYGITPSAEEVNWQLTHNPDINSIDSSIAQAVQSGADTRGKMPAGSATESAATTKADATVSAITSTDANGQDKSLSDMVKELSVSMGLPDITAALEEVDNAMNDEIMSTNDNPWLSEAERSKRTSLIQSKYESKKNALVDRLKLQNDAVSQAVDLYNKDRDYKLQVTKAALDQQNKEIDQQMKMAQMEQDASKTTTSFQSVGNREVMITYDQQGNVVNQTDLGAVTHFSGGSIPSNTPKTKTVVLGDGTRITAEAGGTPNAQGLTEGQDTDIGNAFQWDVDKVKQDIANGQADRNDVANIVKWFQSKYKDYFSEEEIRLALGL